ncbi:MAG: class I SAM-dependent methyltransferase [Mariprofundaceae bacterium]|nr:class I SAM-dependent methyltransferase [Mariprofundaceae bacterium]
MSINDYHKKLTDEKLEGNEHRNFVGSYWDEIGSLQFNFMKDFGLKPSMQFLDVGCGCMRGGRFFVSWLDEGNYFGIDMNESLIKAGYDRELSQELKDKLPVKNLLIDDLFRVNKFNVKFSMALAISVFTHLPLAYLRLCLIELARATEEGAVLFATFFICPEDRSEDDSLMHEQGGVITFPFSDPYHFKFSKLSNSIKGLPWDIELVGDWKHPRGQLMVRFVRK